MSWLLLALQLPLSALAAGDEKKPVDPPAAEPTPPPADDAADDAAPGEVVEVYGQAAVDRAKAALNQKLKDEGYRKGVHQDDHTVFRSYQPWKPQVVVYDDGWVYLRRQPPRVHSPGHSFADQGSPAAYLWCVLAPTACVSIGGWMVGSRKYEAMEGDILDATHAEVNALNEAVAARELARRINTDIPTDLDHIWKLDLPAERRRALIFTFWDTRNDDRAGDTARDAIEAFIRGVIQQSPDAYTAAEITSYNAERHCRRPFLASPPPSP